MPRSLAFADILSIAQLGSVSHAAPPSPEIVVHDLTITGFYFGVVALSEVHLGNATVADSGGAGVVGKKLTLVGTTTWGA